MKRAKKIKWDDGFFMARTDPEWKPRPRAESERPHELDEPFSFDWEKIRKAWEAIGVTWLKEADVRIHIVELGAWERRLKK